MCMSMSMYVLSVVCVLCVACDVGVYMCVCISVWGICVCEYVHVYGEHVCIRMYVLIGATTQMGECQRAVSWN